MKRKNSRLVAQMRAKPTPRKTSKVKSARAKSSREKVRAYRKRMREKGLRLVQMWLPDTRTSELATEAHRQSLLANRAASAAEDRGWTEAMADTPRIRLTFEAIADLIGSVDGMPTDLSARKKEYLQATGYGRKRRR